MSTGNPFLNSTNIKSLVIRPGETQVIKKNWTILKTINEGNVSVSSNCSDIESRLNATAEELVRYALVVETADDILHAGGTTDYITGVGTRSDFYPFASPIDVSAYQTTSPITSSGPYLLFKAIVETFPSGSVLFRDPVYEYGNWAGPSGSTSQDNVYRGALLFKSFPSIIEDMGFYMLFKDTPTHGTVRTPYDKRIYPVQG